MHGCHAGYKIPGGGQIKYIDFPLFLGQNKHMPEKVKSSKKIQQFFAPALVVIAIGLAFFSGTLWQKVKNLEKGSGAAGTTTQGTTTGTTQPTVTLDTIKGLFSKDVIKFGSASKKVLFVELADPSCPYCHVAGGYNPKLAASIDTQTNRFK
jgi:protein-disulfide isomerase